MEGLMNSIVLPDVRTLEVVPEASKGRHIACKLANPSPSFGELIPVYCGATVLFEGWKSIASNLCEDCDAFVFCPFCGRLRRVQD